MEYHENQHIQLSKIKPNSSSSIVSHKTSPIMVFINLKTYILNKDKAFHVYCLFYYCVFLQLDPTWLSFCHPCLARRFIIINPLVVSESSTTDDIKDDQEDKHNYVDHWDLPPALLEAAKHTSLAGITLIAEQLLVIAPFRAVEVSSYQPSSRVP